MNMHIKVFNNLGLPRLGGKTKKDNVPEKDSKASKIAVMEKKMSEKAKKLGKGTEELNGLAAVEDINKVLNTDPIRPHGPAKELTLDAEDQENAGIILDEIEIGAPAKPGEDIKIGVVTGVKAPDVKLSPVAAPVVSSVTAKAAVAVAVAPAAAPAAPAEEKKEEKTDDNDLNKLFSTDETEENPLAGLINSLPDVTVQELLDDLAEIHGIIKEWRTNAK
jgi:hypothetical protein